MVTLTIVDSHALILILKLMCRMGNNASYHKQQINTICQTPIYLMIIKIRLSNPITSYDQNAPLVGSNIFAHVHVCIYMYVFLCTHVSKYI